MNSLSNDQNPTPQKRPNPFMVALKSIFATIGAISIVFFILFALIIGFAFYSISNGMKSFSSSLNPSMSSKTGLAFNVPNNNAPYIAGIRLNGEITSDTSTIILEKLEAARGDKHAVGILFDVNSPGGSVVASQEIYDAIKETRKTKPVVTYVREVAASGAYYSSASSSKIVANRGSIIGSIGVIMNGFEADKLIQFLKVNPVVIKTGALKDTGSPTRPMNDKDKQYLQELIEETRMQFVDDVKQARKTSDSTMKFMSDGRVILGPQALNLKLIDSIGSKQTALEDVAGLAKQKNVPDLYYYEDIQSFSELFTQKLAGSTTSILRESLLGIFQTPQGNSKVPKAEY
jgi:protease IV